MSDLVLVVSPADGVDWELSGSIPQGVKVYSLIPHVKGAQETIKSHLLALGVFDLTPLFPADLVSEDLKEYPVCGMYGVKDLSDIYNFEEKVGHLPDIIRISINPLKYPKDILDYCKSSEIKVLGSDIFGGDILRGYYDSLFPETFLQAFGEHNTDILEIPGNDPYFITRVYQRKENSGVGSEKLLEYSKPLDKTPPLKIPGRKIFQYEDIKIKGMGDLIIQADRGKFLLKPQDEKFNLPDPLWEDDLIPEDVDREDKELLGTLHRYHVLPKLQELHSDKIWRPVFTKIYPNFWAIKMIPKKYLGWLWKEHLYWMISGKLWKMPSRGLDNLNNR